MEVFIDWIADHPNNIISMDTTEKYQAGEEEILVKIINQQDELIYPFEFLTNLLFLSIMFLL